MKILPRKEFEELARIQRFGEADLAGFIDKFTHEAVVPLKTSTRIKLHELGHVHHDHLAKAIAYFGKGRRTNPLLIRESWASTVDDEIEAEIYSKRMMGKEPTYTVGVKPIWCLLGHDWEPRRALTYVCSRMKKFGITVSAKEQRRLAGIVRRSTGKEIEL